MLDIDYLQARLMQRILQMYYIADLNQAEIAGRLQMSNAKINRLLRKARQSNMVQVRIETPYQHLFDLEAQLKEEFGVPEIQVIPALGSEADLAPLGQAGAYYLLERLQNGDVIAIGGGTTIHALVQALEPKRVYDVAVVPVVGGVQGQVTTDVNYLASAMAEKLGGKAFMLHSPAFMETAQHRDALVSMGPIKEILDLARRANIALLGIGSVVPGVSRFVQFTALSAEEMEQIASHYHGVGEVLAVVYDMAGRPCAKTYEQRVVGLTLEELARIPFRIGLAGTAGKAIPIFGALRGKFFHTLITDESAAEGVIEANRRQTGIRPFHNTAEDLPDDRFQVSGSGLKGAGQG
jgi:DNA-binding transcriptional regulator LsrR (DeoR family)